MSKTETPDIVTMLQTAINDRGKGSVWGYAGLLEDATAEIERLRTELAKQSQWPVLHRRHKGASMTHPLPDKAVEAGARALCLHAGDDPDRLTYAHEMNCAGRDREPMYRWRYWVGFAEACGRAMIAAAQEGHHTPEQREG